MENASKLKIELVYEKKVSYVFVYGKIFICFSGSWERENKREEKEMNAKKEEGEQQINESGWERRKRAKSEINS